MHLKWKRPAIKDLRDAGDFIALDSPAAAERIAERVREAVEYLLEYPNMCRQGRVKGTRELIVSSTPFIIVYRVVSPVIEIKSAKVFFALRGCL